MRNAKFLLFGFFGLIVTISCGTESSDDSEATSIFFGEVKTIAVTLRWTEPVALVEIPPEYQQHFLHQLTLNHSEQSMSDKYLSFTGAKSEDMPVSEVNRLSVDYELLKEMVSEGPLFCSLTRESCAGPASAYVTFTFADGTTQTGLLDGSGCSGLATTQVLCSKKLQDKLKLWQTGR